MNELIENTDSLSITAITKLKHTDLHRAAQKLGSIKALADFLNVNVHDAYSWVSMHRCPPLEPTRHKSQEWIDKLELKLLELTGKTLEELFPSELRNNTDFLSRPKRHVQEKEIRLDALESYAALQQERQERLCLDSADKDDNEEHKHWLTKASKYLNYMQKKVIELRYGLSGDNPQTQLQIAKSLGLSTTRVYQIEKKALSVMREIYPPEGYEIEEEDQGF